MKNVLLIAALSISTFASVSAQVKKDLEFYRYELECVGTGNDGTYLVKVWSYSKKPKIAVNEAKRNAVHGVIFKGFGAGENCQPQKPLAGSPGVEEQFADYFKPFFDDNGKYLKYVGTSSDGSIQSEDIMKVNKEYKIGIVVSVMKDALRAELEQAGVIKSLNSGF